MTETANEFRRLLIMMRSLYSGVSGLRNHQTRQDVIGNNISNVNTTGFKAGRANFQDMLSQTLKGASSAQGNLGGTNPMQVGLGMSVASIDTLFNDGSLQSTGVASDLAISGDGFFVVADGNKQYYTRAGNFSFDAAGNYETAGGLKVMGWMADATGNVSASGTLVPIVKPSGQTMEAKQSTQTTITGNLNASAKYGDGATTSVDLYDSLGTAHKITQSYYKVNQDGTGAIGSGANTWYCKSDVAGITSGSLTNQYTRVKFNTDGSLQNIVTVTPTKTTNTYAETRTVTGLSLDSTTGATTAPAISIAVKDKTGAAGAPITISFTQAGAGTPNVYNYTITGATPATGTATWNPTTATFTGLPSSLTYTSGTDTYTEYINWSSPVAPSALGTGGTVSAVATPAPSSVAKVDNLKLSTSTDTQYLGFTEFDTNGDMHDFQMGYTYSAGTNGAIGAWTCTIKEGSTTLGTANVTWNGTSYSFSPASFNYTDAKGKTQSVELSVTSAKTPDSLAASANFNDPSSATIATSEAQLAFNVLGANSMNINLDRSKITQSSDTSGSNLIIAQDGYQMGTLSGYSFDSSGVMTGTFTNGQKKTLAQVALANFTNPGGLSKVSDTLYEKSNNSGEPSVGEAGSGGRGKITPSSLEMSNVDLAQQFSDMIVTQRGFQANSKIITTSDTMLEELVNLKR
jgi:flagellar hook protein FlgE